MLDQFTNDAVTTLNLALNSTINSMVVDPTFTGFPTTAQFRVRIEDEIIIVGALSNNSWSSLTRGAEGTTAASHPAGAVVTHVFTAGALANNFGTAHGARCYMTANISCLHDADTPITFATGSATEVYDTDSYHNMDSTTSRFTIPTGLGGKYFLNGRGTFDGASDAAARIAFIRKNGSEDLDEFRSNSPGASGNAFTVLTHCVANLVAGDYVELILRQNSSGTINILGTEPRTHFELIWLGA